jgi:hypothetical protein
LVVTVSYPAEWRDIRTSKSPEYFRGQTGSNTDSYPAPTKPGRDVRTSKSLRS